MNNSNPTPTLSNKMLALKHLLLAKGEEYKDNTKNTRMNDLVYKKVFLPEHSYFDSVLDPSKPHMNNSNTYIETEGDVDDMIRLLTQDNWLELVHEFAYCMYQLEGLYDYAIAHPEQNSLSKFTGSFGLFENDYESLSETMTLWVWG